MPVTFPVSLKERESTTSIILQGRWKYFKSVSQPHSEWLIELRHKVMSLELFLTHSAIKPFGIWGENCCPNVSNCRQCLLGRCWLSVCLRGHEDYLSVGSNVNVLAPSFPALPGETLACGAGVGNIRYISLHLVASFCLINMAHNWWSLEQQANFCFRNLSDNISIFPIPMRRVNNRQPSCEFCQEGQTGRMAKLWLQRTQSSLGSRPHTSGMT